ncbi:MAG TPA: hypothetical protein VEK08_22555 [Planctomycetota bacterium]|nr:hypothetical protein [Planctomycetota bacterium]
MAWGPFIALLLRALPEILFLWRARMQRQEREKIHDDVQEFRAALCAGELDSAAVLLERRLREARYVRARRSSADPS